MSEGRAAEHAQRENAPDPDPDPNAASNGAAFPDEAARRTLSQARAAARERGLRPSGSRRGPANTLPPGPGPGKRSSGPQRSGARADARDPQLLDSVLGRLARSYGWNDDLAIGSVMSRWDEIVGPEVARHCTPDSFADGELILRASSTAWATQLRRLAPVLVTRLHDDIGRSVVTSVVVKGPAPASWKRGYRTVRGWRGPRDTYG